MSEIPVSENIAAQGKTFVWHEVYGPKSQDLVDFYTQALDFEATEMPMGEMGTYKMLIANGTPVCGVIGTTEMPNMEGVPAHWSTYLAVDDVDARLAKCVALGAKALHGPMDVPTVCRMVLIQDPGGATIWLFHPAPM